MSKWRIWQTSSVVVQALAAIEALPKTLRRQKLACERLRQIVTLLYVHKAIVASEGLQQRETHRLHQLQQRMHLHDATTPIRR